jgi:hypothetical protein
MDAASPHFIATQKERSHSAIMVRHFLRPLSCRVHRARTLQASVTHPQLYASRGVALNIQNDL